MSIDRHDSPWALTYSSHRDRFPTVLLQMSREYGVTYPYESTIFESVYIVVDGDHVIARDMEFRSAP